MRLKITEALKSYEDRTGEKMTQRDLAKKLFPYSQKRTAEQRVFMLANGKAKRIDIEIALKIADITGVSICFLFGV